MTFDLLVKNAAVLTVDKDMSIHESGYLAVKDGRIAAVGPAAEAAGREAARVIDAHGKLVMPGFVNAHTHVPMAAFRGACEDVRDRLLRYIFPMERKLVSPELVYWSSLFSLAEMLRSGTTAFADMYYFEDEVAKATAAIGMRGLLGETVLGQPAPDAKEPNGGLAYAKNFIADWKGHELVRPCIAPHAPYTVDRTGLEQVRNEAEKLGVDIMMHVAETEPENRQFSASHGSVLKYLDSIDGFLSPRLLAAHMIYLDDSDIELAAKRGMRVAHCPASNSKSGRPICPAWRLTQAGVPLGLATDGPLSGNGMDLQGILNIYPKMQKVREGRRELLPASEALRSATMGGAKAIGLGSEVGSLETGKRADFILVNTEDFNMQPIYDWNAAVVFGMRPHNVESVFVGGKQVVADGRLVLVEQEKIMAEMKKLREKCSSFIASLTYPS